MIDIIRSKTPTEEAGKQLETAFSEAKGKPILFLTSSGSALTLLEYVPESALSENVTISVLHEGYTLDPKINTFSRLTETDFYNRAADKMCSFIDTRPLKGETLKKFANRIEIGLRSWRALNKNGIIIITQGISAGGHTAGIISFPDNLVLFTGLFENKDKWMVGYENTSEKGHIERVTTTFPFLRNEVDVSIGFAIGEEKREILNKLFNEKGAISELPARIMKEMKKVIFVSDVV